ncbi:MAG: hypothetical protein ACU0BS_14030 [Hasllibacter sp.]
MDQDDKVRENRLRRVAGRRGLRLERSRRRDAAATGYGGYRLVDTVGGGVVFGDERHEFGATLDQIEAALTNGLSADYGPR